MRRLSGIAIVASGLLVPAAASAHIQLTSPPARYVQNNNGLKTAPCGSGTATAAATKLAAGQTLTVTWKESVSHAGHYRIALSANQSEFVGPTSLAISDPVPAWVLVDGIPDKTGTQTYSQTVQIPSQECRACVLQLIQVMSTGTDGTNTGSFSGVYYACADLDISATGGGDAGADVVGATDTRPDLGGGDGVVVGGRDGAAGRDVGAGGAGAGGNPGRGGTSGPGGVGGSGAAGSGAGGATAMGGSGRGGSTSSGGVAGAGGDGAGTGGASSGSGGTVAGGALGTGGVAGRGAGGGGGTTAGMGGSIGAGGMATETGGPRGGTTVGSGGVTSGSPGTAGSGNPPETRSTGVGCMTGGAGARSSATLSAALSLLALVMGLGRRRCGRSR